MLPANPVEQERTRLTAEPSRYFGKRRWWQAGPGERDGVEVSQERLMSSDQSGEPPLLQEEADPGPKTGGKDEARLGSEGGSGGMVSEAFIS